MGSMTQTEYEATTLQRGDLLYLRDEAKVGSVLENGGIVVEIAPDADYEVTRALRFKTGSLVCYDETVYMRQPPGDWVHVSGAYRNAQPTDETMYHLLNSDLARLIFNP